MKVLVTRAVGQASALSEPLAARGFTPVLLPCIEIHNTLDRETAMRRLGELASYNWVVFTSANAVRAVLLWLEDTSVPPGVRIAVVGPGTRKALQSFAWEADLVAGEYNAEQLAVEMQIAQGERVLWFRGDRASMDLPNVLSRKGALLDAELVYRSVSVAPAVVAQGLLQLGDSPADAVTVANPMALDSLYWGAREAGLLSWFRETPVYCLGKLTAQRAADLGLGRVNVAAANTVECLVEAISTGEAIGC